MNSLGLFALCLTLATLIGIVNSRSVQLPQSIGILLFSLIFSLLIKLCDTLLPGDALGATFVRLLHQADLPGTLLDTALSFLLFAGAIEIDIAHLLERKFSVLLLAVLGTLLSVGFLAVSMWWILSTLGFPIPLIWCVVLGAIISPTDPISVVGMLRRLGLPASLQTIFAGESLLNDGVSIVVFSLVLTLSTGDAQHIGVFHALQTFGREAIGGACLGFISGIAAIICLRLTKESELQLFITLCLAAGTYSLAQALHMSGPIAVVFAGFLMATKRAKASIEPANTREIASFWHVIDAVLNALLHLIIGLTVFTSLPKGPALLALVIGIPLSILARATSVSLALFPISLRKKNWRSTFALLTWGGLRGGISLSLALSLPDGQMKVLLAPVSYGIVVFTILVQGLTIKPVVRRLFPNA